MVIRGWWKRYSTAPRSSSDAADGDAGAVGRVCIRCRGGADGEADAGAAAGIRLHDHRLSGDAGGAAGAVPGSGGDDEIVEHLFQEAAEVAACFLPRTQTVDTGFICLDSE